MILAFCSSQSVVNGTIVHFLAHPVPTVFYGVTSAAAAEVLRLRRFCQAAIEAY